MSITAGKILTKFVTQIVFILFELMSDLAFGPLDFKVVTPTQPM